MKEKKPKSPLIVILAIIFLSIFIVVPPLFRKLYPVEEEVEEVIESSHILSCERISVNDNYKVTYKVTYNNETPLKNVITYEPYTPTADDVASAIPDVKSAEDEMFYFVDFDSIGVVVEESRSIITITDATIKAADEESGIENYFRTNSSEQQTFFEELGGICETIQL